LHLLLLLPHLLLQTWHVPLALVSARFKDAQPNIMMSMSRGLDERAVQDDSTYPSAAP
jgi:hypothetical protein